MSKEFDVIVIGGGITGLGTARDCSLRGLNVLLVERNDIGTGATGRNHGLLQLHQGIQTGLLFLPRHVVPVVLRAEGAVLFRICNFARSNQ